MDAKKLIIMRGLPSCGKSTRAKELAGETGKIFSTDDYFYTENHADRPEEYSFNPRFLAYAHKWNFVRAQLAINVGLSPVIIDNTNTTASEPKNYVAYAIPQDYEVEIAEPTSEWWLEIRELLLDKRKNEAKLKEWSEKLAALSEKTHNVPDFAILRMMRRWHNNLTVEDILDAPDFAN